MNPIIQEIPKEFQSAAEAMLGADFRPELTVTRAVAPKRIAKHSIAFAAGIKTATHQTEEEEINSESGAGRFVLMYSPNSEEEWGGKFRVVSYAQAPLEPEIGTDPFIADVAWSWLLDALHHTNAEYVNISGTATNTISTGYGGLAADGSATNLELRASWTPSGDSFERHAEAWSHLLCMLAGLPLQAGTASLDSQRIRKQKNNNV